MTYYRCLFMYSRNYDGNGYDNERKQPQAIDKKKINFL